MIGKAKICIALKDVDHQMQNVIANKNAWMAAAFLNGAWIIWFILALTNFSFEKAHQQETKGEN